MSRIHHLTYINTENILYICLYYVNLIIYNIYIYLRIHTNLVIYVIVTDFLFIQYIYIYYKI